MKNSNLTPIMVMGNIFKKNGGVTKAIYHRVNALIKEYNEVIICTFNYHPNFNELVEYHKSNGNIDQKVKIFNLFESTDQFINNQTYINNSKEARFLDENMRYQDKNNPNVYRCFNKSGHYVMYELYRENNIEFVDHFEVPWTRVRKEIFDSNGNTRKVIHMDKLKNKPAFNCYYSPDGTSVLSTKVDINTGKETNFFYHINGQEYQNELELLAGWLQGIVNMFSNPVLFIDKREFVLPFMNIKHENLKKIFILHNVHLKTPYDDITKLEPTCEPLFQNINSIDKLVVLTNEQYKDISKVFGHENKMVVIPHFQNKVEIFHTTREENLVISLARYHRQKNLKDAIQVIKKVAKKIPNVKYHIYGYGALEKELENQIKELNLENNIQLKGFTDNPIAELQKASVMLMTSLYEGSPLVINEALACGTPIVSYNTRYGPNEVVRNGVDGIITEKYDIDATAKAVIELLKNKKLYQRMSENGPEVVQRYNEKEISQKWIDMLANL